MISPNREQAAQLQAMTEHLANHGRFISHKTKSGWLPAKHAPESRSLNRGTQKLLRELGDVAKTNRRLVRDLQQAGHVIKYRCGAQGLIRIELANGSSYLETDPDFAAIAASLLDYNENHFQGLQSTIVDGLV